MLLIPAHNSSGTLSMVRCLFSFFFISAFRMKTTVYQKRKKDIILSNFGIGSARIYHKIKSYESCNKAIVFSTSHTSLVIQCILITYHMIIYFKQDHSLNPNMYPELSHQLVLIIYFNYFKFNVSIL